MISSAQLQPNPVLIQQITKAKLSSNSEHATYNDRLTIKTTISEKFKNSIKFNFRKTTKQAESFNSFHQEALPRTFH